MSSQHPSIRQRFKKLLRTEPRNSTAELPVHEQVPPVEDVSPREEHILGEGAMPAATDVKVTDSDNDDKSPIWDRSMRRFACEQSELYELMKHHIATFGVQSVNNWDTWLNDREKEVDNIWLHRCKAYLPSFKAVKGGAIALSNLDPHGVARLITTGIFVAVELFFESVDPSSRDKAMSIMLKVKGLIDKWTDAEVDLQQLRGQVSDSDQNLKKLLEIEKSLEILYLGCLELISKIYKSGKTRHGRLKATLAFGPVEWDRLYQKLNDKNTECSEWKSQVELGMKRDEANIAILDKIRDRSKDPEPGYQTIMERTGISNANSTAGNWFLETEEFTSWLGEIRHGEATSRLFWLKGPMGTGKTTLMSRVLSQSREQPIEGVKFVPYYCYASGTGQESAAPTHEVIIRGLCRRLAWNSDRSLAEPARHLFSRRDPDECFSVTSTWAPLLKQLIASGKSKVVFAIDALDECEDMEQYNRFLRFLADLPIGQNGPYFIISSRPHVQVGDYFENCIRFEVVSQKANDDMRKFIIDEINSRDNKTWKKSIFFQDDGTSRRRLEKALYETSDGMFRWVEIWLGIFFPANQKPVRQVAHAERLLADMENLKTLERLSKLLSNQAEHSRGRPRNQLGEAYSRLWDLNGGEQYNDLQVTVFRIVMGALEPLSPQALLEAICLARPEAPLELDELEGLYYNFLKVDSQGSLTFEHHSAKIFISEIKNEGSSDLMFSESTCNRLLADLTIKAITQPKHSTWIRSQIDLLDVQLRSRRSLWRFLDTPEGKRILAMSTSVYFSKYIITYWISHWRSRRHDSQFVRNVIDMCQTAKNSFEGLILITAAVSNHYFQKPNIYPAEQAVVPPSHQFEGEEAANPSVSLFHLMVALGFSPFTRDETSQPYLLPGFQIADIMLPNYAGQTALHIACHGGVFEIVTELLEFVSATESTCMHILKSRDHHGTTAMHIASEKSTAANEEIIKIMLEFEKRETANQTNDDSPSISKLLFDRHIGDREIVAKMVQNYSDAFLEWVFTRYTPGPGYPLDYGLIKAADWGKEKTVRALINNGGKFNVESADYYLNLIREAVKDENLKVLQQLVISTIGLPFGTLQHMAKAIDPNSF